MTQEQYHEMVMENNRDIGAIWESVRSAHHRIDSNDDITAGIHKIAVTDETLTQQVKHLAERMDHSLQSVEMRLKEQGERIGALEKKPGKKWETVTEKVLLVVVSGVVAFMMARMGM